MGVVTGLEIEVHADATVKTDQLYLYVHGRAGKGVFLQRGASLGRSK